MNMSKTDWTQPGSHNFLCQYIKMAPAAYLVLGNSCTSGCTVGPVVQVLVVWCVIVHFERQNETSWEHSTQGVIHLVGKCEHIFSLNKQTNKLMFG